MAKQPVEQDAVTLLLTNQNIDLQRQVTDLRRDLEAARKETEMLWKTLERPSVAMLNEEQVRLLGEMVWSYIMQHPIPKEEKPA